MNAGFEDCTVMWNLMQKHNENWEEVFEEYQTLRKPDGDAVQDLSLHNYYVMRDYVSDPEFLLQKKFERRIQELYPNKYMPLYSQVSFSNIRYSETWSKGMKQDEFIKNIMKNHDVESLINENKIDDLIHSVFKNL
jgi:kynurenine 3-monooxygenase